MKTFCLNLGICFLVMLGIFSMSMILVHLIPKKAISENIVNSCEVLNEEGVYKDLFNFSLFSLDNFTDTYMMNIAATANSDKPVEAAMMNYHQMDFDYANLIPRTKEIAENDNTSYKKETYGRYWHGYQVFLRPILTFLDYRGIRILNYVLFSILVTVCFVLLRKQVSLAVGVIFLLTLLLINFPMVPMSMQFSTCFYISFVSMIFILRKTNITANLSSLCCTFFMIGGLTSFLDLLTTPQLTLGLPLIAYVLKNKDYRWKVIICACLAWGLGYGLLWATKWLMVFLLTGNNILEDALAAAKMRSSNVLYEKEISIFYIINRFLLLDSVWLGMMSGILLVLYILVFKKNWNVLKEYSALILIALIVPCWYILMRNHSLEHIWFTWRALLVSLFSLLLFVYYTTDIKMLWKRK